MFDLLLKADLTGVPVPLPGRAIIFLGSDGLLKARLSDGSVVSTQGPQGPQGPQGLQGLPSNPLRAQAIVVQNATDVPAVGLSVQASDMLANGGCFSWSLYGVCTTTNVNANMVVGVRINGVLKASNLVPLGNLVQTNKVWEALGKIWFVGGAVLCTVAVNANTPNNLTGMQVGGSGLGFAVSGTCLIEVVFYLSVAGSGDTMKTLAGAVLLDYKL